MSPMLREARRAVDAAMSRDRGRLQGLWSRWRDRPDDPRAQAAFEQASAALKAAEQATAQRDALQQQLQVSLNSILATSRTARG